MKVLVLDLSRAILTVRDNVGVWHESIIQTTWPFVEKLVLRGVSVWGGAWRWFLGRYSFGGVGELFHLNPEGM